MARGRMKLLAFLCLVVLIVGGSAATSTRSSPTTPTAPLPAAPPSVYLLPSYLQGANQELMALNASTGTVRWRYPTGTAQVAPILKDGVLYVGSFAPVGTSASQSSVSAFRASDGTLLWQRHLLAGVVKLEVSAGVVYASAEHYNSTEEHIDVASTAAFRASDGTLLWHFDQGTLVAVAAGVVYVSGFATTDSPLYAVNAKDGSIKWQEQGPYATAWEVYPTAGLVFALLFQGGDDSFCGCLLPFKLVALNSSTGHPVWSRSSPAWYWLPPMLQVTVVAEGGGSFVGVPPEPHQSLSDLYGVNAGDGSVTWHRQIPSVAFIFQRVTANVTGSGVFSTGIVSGKGVLYLGATDQTLAALDANTGSTLWRVPLSAVGAPSLTTDGLLVVGASPLFVDGKNWPPGRLEVHDAQNGSLKWAYQFPNLPTESGVGVQALVNGMLYTTVIDFAGPLPTDPVTGNPEGPAVLAAFNASTGTMKWHVDLGNLPGEEPLLTVG